MGRIEVKETYSLEDVKKIHLEIACATLIFQETEGTDQITVEASYEEDRKFSCNVKNEKLICKSGDEKTDLNVGFDLKKRKWKTDESDSVRITLTVPAQAVFEKIKLELGAGTADIRCDTTEYRKAEIETGAGNLNVDRLNVKEKLEAGVGAGTVKMNKITAAETEVECGVGKFYLNGVVNGNLDVECGVGSCEILLDADEKEYSYEASSGLGKVIINGNKCAGIGSHYSLENSGAVGNINLSCGVGSITLTTQKRIG